jgi:hypothetical protein
MPRQFGVPRRHRLRDGVAHNHPYVRRASSTSLSAPQAGTTITSMDSVKQDVRFTDKHQGRTTIAPANRPS